MRRLAIPALAAALLGPLACAERPRPALDRTTAEHSTEAETSLRARLAGGIQRARSRLEHSRALPETRERQRCPDEVLAVGAADRTSMVHVRDGRSETRAPLPLELLGSLGTNEFETVLAHISGGPAALWDESRIALLNPEAGEQALRALQELEHRRYLIDLVVESYAEPKLFRRKDARRSEWAAGHLSGRIVVHDLQEGRALCQAPLAVRGDASGAPISRRLRETTRERLRRDLLNRAWTNMEIALSSISARLELPPAARRADPGQRWAAPEEVARAAVRQRGTDATRRSSR